MISKRITLFAAIGIIAFSTAFRASGQEAITKIQSLYLYNFAKYIQWSNPGDKMVIGIFANNDSYNQLAAVLKSRKVGARPIEVKKLTSAKEATSCDMVFISDSHSYNFKKVIALDLSNTLLVTSKDMTDKGASISFVLKDSRLKFKINQEACRAAGLQVSNNLLALGA